jgi:TonB family protein
VRDSVRMLIPSLPALLLLGGAATAQPIGVDDVLGVRTPVYPAVARTAGVSGEVTVEIAVDRNGRVVTATGHSTGLAALFTRAAEDAAKQWRFKAGRARSLALSFRFSSLPQCASPAEVSLYRPPYAVEVMAAVPLGTCQDCSRQPQCPAISVAPTSPGSDGPAVERLAIQAAAAVPYQVGDPTELPNSNNSLPVDSGEKPRAYGSGKDGKRDVARRQVPCGHFARRGRSSGDRSPRRSCARR